MVAVRYKAIPVVDPQTGRPLLEARGAVGNIVIDGTNTPCRLSEDKAGNIPIPQPITLTPGGYIPAHWNQDGLEEALFVPLSGTWSTPIDSSQGLRNAAIAAATEAETAAAAAQDARQAAVNAAALVGAPADEAVAGMVESAESLTGAAVRALVGDGGSGVSVEWGSIPEKPAEGTLLGGDGVEVVEDVEAGTTTVRAVGRLSQEALDAKYVADPRALPQTTVYVNPTGSDANDGLTAGAPKATIQAAFDAVAEARPVLGGQWRVILAAGTYTAPAQLSGLASEQLLVVEGPPAAYGAPTAIIDPGAGAAYGLWFGHGMRVVVRDVMVRNVTGSTVASGVVLDFGTYGWLDNVHTDNCTWAGVNANISCRLVVQGGNLAAQTYGIRVYGGSVATIGYQGQRTTVTAVTGVIFQANSSGHTDNTDFTDCDTGLIAESRSHTSNYANTYTNCGVGWQTSGFGSIATDAATRAALTNVTIPSRHRAGFATGDAEATHRHAIQYRDDLGAGRFAFGYPDWTAPWVKYQFSNGSTGANLSSYAPCSMLLESDANTILGLTSKAANTSELWFGSDATSNAFVLRYSTAVAAAEMRFGATTAYRFRPTDIFPLTDNALDMGRATFRWRNVYAGTGTIQTSDEREKQDIAPLDDRVLDAWADVELAGFRFKDAVAQKGDAARTHVGVIAQRIVAAFEAHGLDAFDYGLVTYEEWDDEVDTDGTVVAEAGNRFGVRADECLFLEAALVRRRLDAIGA